jgi:digeranylgeranylglycerophospholipid reductase
LTSFIEPDPRWISAEVSQTEITCVADGAQQTLRMTGGRGYVLERRIFDRALAERAAQASAQVRVKTAVTGLLIEDGHVCGVGIERGDFYTGPGEAQVRAKIVIAADGVESQVGCWANLEVQLPLEDMMVCAQYLLAGVKIDPTCTCYTISHEIAPGGYAWIFPKGEGKANVGLGAQADLPALAGRPGWPAGAAKLGDKTAMDYLNRFIERHSVLTQGYPVTW